MGCGSELLGGDHCTQLNVPGLEKQLDQWCHEYNVTSLHDVMDQFDITQCDCLNQHHLFIPNCNCTAQERPFPYGEVLPLGVVYALVLLLGAVGNTLVIFVVNRFRKMRTTTNLFLASLAIADLCLICFCLPIQYAKYLSYSWFFDAFLCYSVHYVQQLTRFCSVLTLTAISIERYIAIAFPMKIGWVGSLGRTKKIILVIWIAASLLAIPTALRIDYTSFMDARNVSISWCQRQYPPQLAWLEEAYGLYQFLLLLVLPLTCMTYCYIKVAHAVNRSSSDKTLREEMNRSVDHGQPEDGSPLSSRRKSSMFSKFMSSHTESNVMSPTRIREQNRIQIMQILVAIVLLYIICWTGTLIDELLVCFKFVCHTSRTEGVKKLRMTLAVLAFSNSAINPVVYAFLSRNFRASFRSACQCVQTPPTRHPTVRSCKTAHSVKTRKMTAQPLNIKKSASDLTVLPLSPVWSKQRLTVTKLKTENVTPSTSNVDMKLDPKNTPHLYTTPIFV